MRGSHVEIWRELFVAQPFHKLRAARVKAASGWWVHQAGWLTGWNLFINQGVVRIRLGGACQ